MNQFESHWSHPYKSVSLIFSTFSNHLYSLGSEKGKSFGFIHFENIWSNFLSSLQFSSKNVTLFIFLNRKIFNLLYKLFDSELEKWNVFNLLNNLLNYQKIYWIDNSQLSTSVNNHLQLGYGALFHPSEKRQILLTQNFYRSPNFRFIAFLLNNWFGLRRTPIHHRAGGRWMGADQWVSALNTFTSIYLMLFSFLHYFCQFLTKFIQRQSDDIRKTAVHCLHQRGTFGLNGIRTRAGPADFLEIFCCKSMLSIYVV